MATKSNPGECDCYDKAEPDEPMFVLLGRDRHAPTLVWLWATLRELDDENPAVVSDARDTVAAMIKWAAQHGRQSAGLGQATLAGVMELIRSVNGAVKNADNAQTSDEILRRWLAATEIEVAAEAAPDAGKGV
jgi:hypothetical protein